MTKFDELCKTLGMDVLSASDENLAKLMDWCKKTISTDCHFEGEFEARFDAYKTLISKFLENIKPNVQAAHLTVPVPALNNMTPLQAIVNLGLDVYLKKLNPTPTPKQINVKVNDCSLLQLAAVRGHLHTTEVLLTLGANPEEKMTKGIPILFSALMLPMDHDEEMIRNKESIYRILSQDIKDSLTQRNESGDTLLHMMAVYGYAKLIQDILPKAKVLASTPNHLTHYPIHAAVLNAQHECAKCLIAVEGVEHLTDAKGRNALHYAAKYGDKEMVQICMNSPIAIDSVDERDQTPLILAILALNIEAVRVLLDSGAQINMTDNVHRTALHYAVEANDVDMVKLLLSSKDIDVNMSDENAQNPLDLIQTGTPEGDEISELLVKKNAVHGRRPMNSI